MRRLLAPLACSILALTSACDEQRARSAPEPVYAADLEQVLDARCERCHGAEDARADYRVDTYAGVLGCPSSAPEQRAVDLDAAGDRAILKVLERPDHAELLEDAEYSRLRDWLEGEVPLRASAVHSTQLENSRSRDWHGKLAAVDRFAPLTAREHAGACGRCHAGAPVTPQGVKYPAPGAPACTQCHTQPEGVLACGTCHGDGAQRAYPPRDACLFGPTQADAHRVHLESTRLTAQPLSCTNCHPAADASLGGSHGDGKIDVAFDATLAGPAASYDPQTGACSVACHNRGGARPTPAFHESGPLGCNDCHRTPPDSHYAGPCNGCHRELDAAGSKLQSVALHLNGRVDLGAGGGGCGDCHGSGDDPMPRTPSHERHRATLLTREVTCAECHVVPDSASAPGHLDVGATTPADVVFGARASARGQPASIEAQTCRGIACHGAGLPDGSERALVWNAPAASSCSGCHGIPPRKDHPASDGCASLTCHGDEVSVAAPFAITEPGRSLHIDGSIDARGR
ncbi:MAG TPA: CxxxxCH/CxxCH domain-containing protein [Polyangiales bacterium]|nr:CxxxxCH/CxxCH domain-containing protein [Polyangiales bacterium]